jgi:hypothetical protein
VRYLASDPDGVTSLGNVDVGGKRITPRNFADCADEAFVQSLKTRGTVLSGECEVPGEP